MKRLTFGLTLLFAATQVAAAALEPLVIYTERKPFLIEPLLAKYTKETGQPVHVLSDQASVLIERLQAEGSYTKADVLLTVDAGSLWLASERGLLGTMQSPTLLANVPAHLRDSATPMRWVGLSLRARTMLVNPAKLDPELANSYAALALPALKGKLCLRSSKKIYNQSLVAMLIARYGEAKTEQMVRGWVGNLAARPFADDTLMIEAIAAGRCAVGLLNTYYYGRAVKADAKLNALQIVWADQQDAGVHVNVSGAGVVKHSNQRAAAQKLIEWLSAVEAQADFASVNLEMPVNAAAKLDPIIQSWGNYRVDPNNISLAGKYQSQAVRLMDRAGWK